MAKTTVEIQDLIERKIETLVAREEAAKSDAKFYRDKWLENTGKFNWAEFLFGIVAGTFGTFAITIAMHH